MIQLCKTCGCTFHYHDSCDECLPCQQIRTDRSLRITRIFVTTFWTMALLSVAASIILVIWRSLPQW